MLLGDNIGWRELREAEAASGKRELRARALLIGVCIAFLLVLCLNGYGP